MNRKHIFKWLLFLGIAAFVFLYFKLSLTEYGFKGNIQRAIPKKWNGVYKEHYANGTLKAETPLRFGRRHGIQKQYYEDGNLSIIKEYKDGKAQISKQYYPSGELMVETFYDKDGYAHGLSRGYYKDGKLKSDESTETRWRKEYDEQGNLIYEGKL